MSELSWASLNESIFDRVSLVRITMWFWIINYRFLHALYQRFYGNYLMNLELRQCCPSSSKLWFHWLQATYNEYFVISHFIFVCNLRSPILNDQHCPYIVIPVSIQTQMYCGSKIPSGCWWSWSYSIVFNLLICKISLVICNTGWRISSVQLF